MAAAESSNVPVSPWLTTEEAAEYLRITPAALRQAVWRGSIKPDCYGGRGRTRSHRFRRTTLDRFLEGS